MTEREKERQRDVERREERRKENGVLALDTTLPTRRARTEKSPAFLLASVSLDRDRDHARGRRLSAYAPSLCRLNPCCHHLPLTTRPPHSRQQGSHISISMPKSMPHAAGCDGDRRGCDAAETVPGIRSGMSNAMAISALLLVTTLIAACRTRHLLTFIFYA